MPGAPSQSQEIAGNDKGSGRTVDTGMSRHGVGAIASAATDRADPAQPQGHTTATYPWEES
jgi:hypothetical protein